MGQRSDERIERSSVSCPKTAVADKKNGIAMSPVILDPVTPLSQLTTKMQDDLRELEAPRKSHKHL